MLDDKGFGGHNFTAVFFFGGKKKHVFFLADKSFFWYVQQNKKNAEISAKIMLVAGNGMCVAKIQKKIKQSSDPRKANQNCFHHICEKMGGGGGSEDRWQLPEGCLGLIDFRFTWKKFTII